MSNETKLIARLVQEIAPILHGHDPLVQSAVLADLFAMWLAGHQGRDAEKYREEAIKLWLSMVRELVPENEKLIVLQESSTTRRELQ